MSGSELAKLIRMANQIAAALESQRGDAVSETAAHLQSFWPRPMQKKIVRHLLAGGEGLSATAQAAIASLASSTRPPVVSGER